MYLIIIIRTLISISLTLHLCISPIILGIYVFLFALVICLILIIFASSWLGILIFLIYVGGLLIIFSYLAALSPNQYFYLKELIVITVILLIRLSLVTKKTFFIKVIRGTKIANIFSYLSNNNLPILLFSVVVLFLILVAAVKNVGGLGRPLRPFN